MKRYLMFSGLIIMLILSGCTGKGMTNINRNVSDKTAQSTVKPISVTDFAGRSVTVTKHPQKIVSLSPAITEILYSMGYGDKIIAVTQETVYPEVVKQKTKVGTYADIDIDAVEKIAPDVIFASKYTYKSMAQSFTELNIPVVYAEAENYNGIFDSIKMLGKILNEENKANELSNSIKQKVEQIRNGESSQKPNVLYIQSLEPLYVAGSNTLINDEIWLSGGANVAQNINGYGEENKNSLSNKKIDIIVLSNKLAASGIDANYLKDYDGFKDLDAVKNGKVYAISDEELSQTPGTRITNAIEDMKEIITKQ